MRVQVHSSIVLAIMIALVLTGGVTLAKPMEDVVDLDAPPLSHYIRIEEAAVDTLSPAVAYNSRHQEFLVVWEQHINGGEVAIYGRRISIGGQTIGPAFPVLHNPNKQYYRPAVAYSPRQDSYLVALHYKFSASDYDVYAVPVSADGTPGSLLVIDNDYDWDWYPAIAYNSQADEFLVVLEKYASGVRRDIEAHRIRASDWTEASWRNIAGADNQLRRLPDVAYNAARNEYLIGYILNSPPAGGGDAVARIVKHHLGNPLGPELPITPFGSGPSQTGLALAAGPDEYLCVFDEDHGPSSYQVWGRRIGGNGSMDNFINFNPTGMSRLEADVAYGEGGHYLVAFRRITTASNWDTFGQFIRALPATPLEDTEFGIHDVTGHQLVPAVACSPSGPCLMVNEENQNLGGGGVYDLWGRLVGHYRVSLPLVVRRR